MSTPATTSSDGLADRMMQLFWRGPAPGLPERTRRRVALYLIPYLFFLYILAYLDRVNVSVAQLGMEELPLSATAASTVGLLGSPQGLLLAPTGFLIRMEPFGLGGLGFTRSIIGFGAGLFFWGYWLLEIPSTVSVLRWGARWVFVRILVLWGLCATLVGFIGTPFADRLFTWLPYLGLRNNSVHQFYALRFLLGFFEGGFFPSVIVYLSLWFRPRDRAKAIAGFMAAIPLSSMLGQPLSGLLLDVNWLGLQGWRWIFILQGIAPVLAGFATLFFLPDWPAKAAWLPDGERDWLMGQLEHEHQAKQGHGGHWVWVHHLGMVLLLTFVYFCQNLTSYGMSMFMTAIIKSQSGLSGKYASFLAGLPYLMGLIGMLLNGRHSDRTGERFWHAAVPLTLFSAGIWVAALCDGIPVLPVVIMIFWVGTFMYAHLPAFWPIPTMFLGATAAASAIGFINMIGNLGGFVGPMLVGKEATGQVSFAPALRLLAPWPLLAAVIILVAGYFRRRHPIVEPTEPDLASAPPLTPALNQDEAGRITTEEGRRVQAEPDR
jgi:MFS family permease